MRTKFDGTTWAFALLIMAFAGNAAAHAAHADLAKLPAGPIRDRVQLMEDIGADAKKINEALKAGDAQAMIAPAEHIAAIAPQFPELFPEGSTDPSSRAKPNIWTKPDEFEAHNEYLVQHAIAIATAAKSGGNTKAAVRKLFKDCKGCHKQYRIPDED
ncbi:MAG: cytochrome c [Deltaproteobacteria bacterium]